MLATHWFRLGTCLSLVMAGSSMMSGCASSPTYGTDKTAMEQLADDLGQSVSLTGPGPKNTGVKYTPRPTLVMPAKDQKETLVPPQENVANKDNPQWVESPEEARARLVKEADENSDNPSYRSPLASSAIEGGRQTSEAQAKAYREARALQKGAYIDQRRYISDPPTEYRAVDDPAKLDDLGTPEQKKAKQRKKDAAVANSGTKWWQILQ
ncbi:hypothetical protein [Rhizobium mesosinicum]|uniref:Lipoprotein n=1 Tax=Rhizobium mesosinicum TaxID=335017 RepID=A0ABS7GNW3_9HYPH|nr:hypothetical protein [Rhizobium mesosinicum]MBW9051615.1 hypothetical protein [Rhizobium mesosinicum]